MSSCSRPHTPFPAHPFPFFLSLLEILHLIALIHLRKFGTANESSWLLSRAREDLSDVLFYSLLRWWWMLSKCHRAVLIFPNTASKQPKINREGKRAQLTTVSKQWLMHSPSSAFLFPCVDLEKVERRAAADIFICSTSLGLPLATLQRPARSIMNCSSTTAQGI